MNGALRLNTVAMPRASMVTRGERRRGGLETRETGWCRLGGRGGRADKRDNEMLWRFCLWLPTEAWRTHAQWSDSDSDNIQKADLHTHIHTMLIFFPACSQKTWICLRRLIFRFSCTACHFWIREGFCFVLGGFFSLQCDPAVWSNTNWWSSKHSREDATELDQVPGQFQTCTGPQYLHCKTKEHFKNTARKGCDLTFFFFFFKCLAGCSTSFQL